MNDKILKLLLESKISYREMSIQLGVSEGAIKQRVHRDEKLSWAKKYNQSLGKTSSIKFKICRHCNVYIGNRTRKNKGLCRKCTNKDKLKYNSKYQREMIKKSQKDKKYYIYYLPEEHYIGVAVIPKRRVSQHKSRGKIIEGWEIVAEYSDPKLCALHEALLHYIGYNGSQYDNMLKAKRNEKINI